ncbi:sister chromatid cohesion protein dcc1 [Stemphylium lycopersici]|uniref:Sister chromatid cohesion protein dcc1 n=1 Tax=Stemphylium lycopersici TaxID=183478 RepID=A0A364NCX5_STELY|nr:sister chromatid cohesion protein dcc1 [Stemphylium lycopersici]
MATQQDHGGVPFSVAHEHQHFRLLELPPEIVDLIDAPDPPLLSIKSPAPSAASGTANEKPAYAVLCTPNKSFQLRQVQTSNSLFVTQPALEAHGNEIPIPATRAIALCTTTLELHASTISAATLLRDVLPIYDIVAGDVDATGNGRSKVNVFDDMPMSDGECQAGWIQLMAFETGDGSYQPSPNALSHVWRSINAAALAEGVPLDKQFMTDDITRAAGEEGHPADLIHAVLTYLSTDDTDKSGPWSCLDRAKTVAFTGKTLLEAKRGTDFLIADFTGTWEDRLPEVWRKDAQLTAIEGFYEFPSDTTIKAKGSAVAVASAESGTASLKPSALSGDDGPTAPAPPVVNDATSTAPTPEEKPLPKLTPFEFRQYNRMAEHMQYFHDNFRATWKVLYAACDSQKRPKNMSIRQFVSTGQQFCHHLTVHHTIEEQHIFPVLAKKMPAFKKELELLTQHKQIHVGLDKLEKYLEECESGERELRMAELKEILDSFGDVLWQHLDDEVKQLEAENMRKYWTIDEMRRIPM